MPFFGYAENKNHGVTYTNIERYMFSVAKHTNIHASEQCFGTYNVGVGNDHVYIKQYSEKTLHNYCILKFDNNKRINMKGSYMLGFGQLRDINVKGYYEQKRIYAQTKQNKPSLNELMFKMACMWGVRFVGHCLNLYGSGYKVIPLIGIKERPPDHPFHNLVLTDETKNAGCQNDYGTCQFLIKDCQFCEVVNCFLTQYATGYKTIYGSRQIANNCKYISTENKVAGYKYGFKLFNKGMPMDLTQNRELRHDRGLPN